MNIVQSWQLFKVNMQCVRNFTYTHFLFTSTIVLSPSLSLGQDFLSTTSFKHFNSWILSTNECMIPKLYLTGYRMTIFCTFYPILNKPKHIWLHYIIVWYLHFLQNLDYLLEHNQNSIFETETLAGHIWLPYRHWDSKIRRKKCTLLNSH